MATTSKRIPPPGFFSDDEEDDKSSVMSEMSLADFEMNNPMLRAKANNNSTNVGASITGTSVEVVIRPPNGFSFDDTVEQKQAEESTVTSQQATARSIIPSLPTDFFSRKSKALSKHKSKSGKTVAKTPSSEDIETKEESKDEEMKKNDADDILAMLERSATRKSIAKRPSALGVSVVETKEDDILAKFEAPTSVLSSFSPAQSPGPEQQQSPSSPKSDAHVPPELPPRRLKKGESSQSITGDQAATKTTTTAKGNLVRRRTSFLEALLKEKHDRGEIDFALYMGEGTTMVLQLEPEEERETGMSKEEIQEKIKRIAQKAAVGHDTSAMGIGLRDLGYAVAKSREEQSTDSVNSKMNVRSIARHAEEIYRNAASNASDSGANKRRESSSAQQQMAQNQQVLRVQQQFEPIGEVSEGAYSIEDSAGRTFSQRKPSVFSQGQQNQTKQRANNKTDRFFGSIRLVTGNLNPNTPKNKSRVAMIKTKIQEIVQRVKESTRKVAERVGDVTYEWKARFKAEIRARKSQRMNRM